jgi:hypothetical protein
MALSTHQRSQGTGPADVEANRKACLQTIGNSYEVKRWCCPCRTFFIPLRSRARSILGRDAGGQIFPDAHLAVRYAPQ